MEQVSQKLGCDVIRMSNKSYSKFLSFHRENSQISTFAQNFIKINPSCTKVFGIDTLYEGGGGVGGGVEPSPPSVISKTIDSTNYTFGRPLGL